MRARSHPEAPAFVSVDGVAGYAAFDADIDRVAGALDGQAGVQPGGLVAVQAANPYLHWLVLMGLARLGVASCPVGPEMPATAVLSDQPGGDILLSVAWVTSVLTAPRPVLPVWKGDLAALARVMPSSGTTGTRKLIGYSWRWVDRAARDGLVACANMPLRMMVLTGTDTLMGFVNLLSAWYGGGTVLGAPAFSALPEVLPRLQPTVLVMATGQLAAFIRMLPKGHALTAGIRVGVAGSALSPTLARRAVEVLQCELTTSYGATEAGLVAMMQAGVGAMPPGAVGYVVPGMLVEVDGTAGGAGEIRVKGDQVVGEYLGDAAASERVFRDGWFYPGDIGRLSVDGLLCVDGRVDEVMNVGGVKFLPGALEGPAGECPGVEEAACFLAPDAAGVSVAHLAVVRGLGFEEAALVQAMVGASPGVVPHMVWVNAIPRNAMGKPDRARLAAVMSAQHTRPSEI